MDRFVPAAVLYVNREKTLLQKFAGADVKPAPAGVVGAEI